MDAEILIALKKGPPTDGIYQRKLREVLLSDFPGTQLLFPAGGHRDPGLELRPHSPLSVQVEGLGLSMRSYPYAQKMHECHATFPGVVDVHINQVLDYPYVAGGRGPDPGGEPGHEPARRGQQPADGAFVEHPGGPGLLSQSTNNVNYTVAVQIPLPRVSTPWAV